MVSALLRRRAVVAFAAAILAAVGLGLFLFLGTGEKGRESGFRPYVGSAGNVPVPAPLGASASGGPGPDSSAPDPSASAGAPPPDRVGPPAALVNPFARGLSASPRTPGPGPTQVSVAPGIDGCDHDYGEPGQCVPWTFPAGVTDRCGWLVARGFGEQPIKARGKDRHHLDRNGDGIACGPGDT